jgi:glycosyltransferase involved in cell wall biosynthesis
MGKALCVSVVITCYNQARFLAEAIESVIAQTRPPLEVFVVDDGSSDDPSAVATRYPSVRFVRQDNQGVAAARNAGLRLCKGEYVVFLDGDDRLLPDAVETGLNHLDAHPECALVSGHFRAITSAGAPAKAWHQPHVTGDHYAELLRRVHIQTPATVMFRRDVLSRVNGFDTSLTFINCEDHELYLRIARSFPVYCHGRTVAEWREHATNTSADAAMMLRSALALYRSQWKYVEGKEQYERAHRSGVRLLQAHFGKKLVPQIWAHVRARAWRRASREMFLLLRHCPPGMLEHALKRIRAGVGSREF